MINFIGKLPIANRIGDKPVTGKAEINVVLQKHRRYAK